MKVILAILFITSAASAIGSGPYLPSGWRPEGPAFVLPTEVRKSETSTTSLPEIKQEAQETPQTYPEEVIQESEAAGSDFLREYGPPDSLDILKSITVQALPDTETERAFAVIDVRIAPKSSVVDQNSVSKGITNDDVAEFSTKSNGNKLTNQISTTVDATTSQEISSTETVFTSEVEKTEGPIVNIEETTTTVYEKYSSEDVTEVNVGLEYLTPSVNENEKCENVTPLLKTISSDDAVRNTASLEYLPPVVNEAEVKIQEPIPLYKAELATGSLEEGVKNINILNETVTKTTIQSTGTLKSLAETVQSVEAAITKSIPEEESSGLEPVSGEQEPNGFREYGPPKSGTPEEKSEAERIQSNETRKRRFLSKFSYKKH